MVDHVYGGDLKGNLWKFDLTDASPNNVEVAFDDGTDPQPLFQAKGPGNTTQPITIKPDAMVHCSNHGYMVLFGTGKYLGESDFTDTSTQTIYGIWDYGDDSDKSEYLGTFNRASAPNLTNQTDNVTLVQQTELAFVTVGDQNLRVLTANAPYWQVVDDADTDQLSNPGSSEDPPETVHAGWCFDLPIQAERVVSDVLLREGNLIVVAYTPSQSPCGAGGNSIIMEMNACSGGRLTAPQFDINGDNIIDESDLVTVQVGTDIHGDPIYQNVAPTGVQAQGRLQPPAILRFGGNINQEIKYFSSSRGSIVTLRERSVRLGVTYWIQY